MALQIAEERREGKSKGERERYNQLNAEFQGLSRREKKAFLNKQCKEIEESNRKVRNFKKTEDNKGTLHANMGTKKDRNSKGLIEAEEFENMWYKCIEELYKKKKS